MRHSIAYRFKNDLILREIISRNDDYIAGVPKNSYRFDGLVKPRTNDFLANIFNSLDEESLT